MKILIVEDDESTRKGIEVFLNSCTYDVATSADGEKALLELAEKKYDLILSDIQMPNVSGFELLNKMKSANDPTPFLMMTAFATVEDAIKAMKMGANDYLTKPVNLEELRIKVEKIANSIKLEKDNKLLQEKIANYEFPDFIGESEAIRSIKEIVNKVAKDSEVPVMIYGKSGTGKEVVARSIHKLSNRSREAFVGINCAALKDDLLESELFGHVKGAFTGAESNRDGLIKHADNGTLFLDEISEMSMTMQSKLLRALQEKVIVPVGSNKEIEVNFRVITASNKNLKELVSKELFRNDLFYRLNVVEINLPQLSERTDDIPILVNHILNKIQSNKEKKIIIGNDVMMALEEYSWPGNIRELENLLNMLSATFSGSKLTIDELPEKIITEKIVSRKKWNSIREESNFQKALASAIENFEKEYITYHLKKQNGNVSRTSEAIKLSRVTLHKKINQYEIKLKTE